MLNKAVTATYRRIARRYGGEANNANGSLIELGELTIAVVTSATLAEGIARLQASNGRRFVAVTNKESISEARQITDRTPIGVMDSRGNIVAEPHGSSPNGNGTVALTRTDAQTAGDKAGKPS